MVLQEGQPFLIRVSAPNDAAQIAGHAPLGDQKAKLLQFRVDFGSVPIGVLVSQSADQIPELVGNAGSPAPRSGSPAPVEGKAATVPSDNGFGFDNQEDIGPAGPNAAQSGPKQPVARVQGRTRSLPFHHGNLLTKGEDFHRGIAPGAEENSGGKQDREGKLDHGFTFVTRCNG